MCMPAFFVTGTCRVIVKHINIWELFCGINQTIGIIFKTLCDLYIIIRVKKYGSTDIVRTTWLNDSIHVDFEQQLKLN